MNAQISRHFALRCKLGAVALAAATFALESQALTETDTLTVSASVSDSCTITATAPVAFGTYDPIVTNATTPLVGTGTVSTTCTSGAAATITLGQGANTVAGTDAAPQRRLLSGTSDYLSYTLYSDTGRNTVWGNTALTGFDAAGTGVAKNATVYGRIAAGQNVPSGTYGDSVVATVTY